MKMCLWQCSRYNFASEDESIANCTPNIKLTKTQPLLVKNTVTILLLLVKKPATNGLPVFLNFEAIRPATAASTSAELKS